MAKRVSIIVLEVLARPVGSSSSVKSTEVVARWVFDSFLEADQFISEDIGFKKLMSRLETESHLWDMMEKKDGQVSS